METATMRFIQGYILGLYTMLPHNRSTSRLSNLSTLKANLTAPCCGWGLLEERGSSCCHHGRRDCRWSRTWRPKSTGALRAKY